MVCLVMALKKNTVVVCILCICLSMCYGCSVTKEDTKKVKDVDFTVVEQEEIPEELYDKIQKSQDEVFQLTYEDQGYLYLAVGYGAQPSGGYSVTVNELYETSNTIQMKTGLLGPSKSETVTTQVTYPYIVVKMEAVDKKTVFR